MSGATDAIGPSSRTAFAMGLSSVANVGSTGAKARRWLDKARESGRRKRQHAKIKYVWDGAGGVKTLLVNVDHEKKPSTSKYAVTPGQLLSSSVGDSGMAHAVTSELREAHRHLMLRRWHARQEVAKQKSVAAKQVDSELSDRYTLDLVLKLLITELANNSTQSLELVSGSRAPGGGGGDSSAKGATHQQDQTYSNFRGNDDALLAFLMELVMEEVLNDLRPKITGINGYTPEEIARVAAQAGTFMTSMAVNRVQNDRSEAEQERLKNLNQLRKDMNKSRRAEARNIKAAAAAAGTREFPVETIPSDIISRARKRLIRFKDPEKISVVDNLVQKSPLSNAIPKAERDNLLKLVPPRRNPRERRESSGDRPNSRMSQMSDHLEQAEERNRASMLAAMLLNTE